MKTKVVHTCKQLIINTNEWKEIFSRYKFLLICMKRSRLHLIIYAAIKKTEKSSRTNKQKVFTIHEAKSFKTILMIKLQKGIKF